MHVPPPHTSAARVLDVVREQWRAGAGSVQHLPLGFGAHHWRVDDLFVTMDVPGHQHTDESLEATYAGAATLAAQGLEFVLAPMPSTGGAYTVPLAGGRLSVTPWRDAPRSATPAGQALLERLHATAPLAGLRRWQPLVPPGLADDLADRTATPWDSGPHAAAVRVLLRDHLGDVAGWTADYHRLAAGTDPLTWVNTHGEPHERNLLAGEDGPLLVDWETLLVAPRERDLRQAGLAGDEGMLRMFDLEWRLDEVAQYAEWFERPHADDEDARVSLGGLQHELTRPSQW